MTPEAVGRDAPRGAPTPRHRIPPPAYFVAAIAAMVLLDRWLPGERWLRGAWRSAGAGVVLAGSALHVAAGNHFRTHRTTTEALGQARTLVTDGPYGRTRNPMYLGGIIMLMGLGLFLGSATPVLVVPLFAVAIWRAFIRHEEAMLADQFGGEYNAYRSTVRRWI